MERPPTPPTHTPLRPVPPPPVQVFPEAAVDSGAGTAPQSRFSAWETDGGRGPCYGGGGGLGRRRGRREAENRADRDGEASGDQEEGREDSAPGEEGAAVRQSVWPAWEVASGIHVNQRARSQWEGAEGAGPGRVPLQAAAAKRAGESWRARGAGGAPSRRVNASEEGEEEKERGRAGGRGRRRR